MKNKIKIFFLKIFLYMIGIYDFMMLLYALAVIFLGGNGITGLNNMLIKTGGSYRGVDHSVGAVVIVTLIVQIMLIKIIISKIKELEVDVKKDISDN